jgi:hypothetical protein
MEGIKMKQYKIKSEYVDLFFGGNPDYENDIIDRAELERLAAGWGKHINELLDQVEEIAAMIYYARLHRTGATDIQGNPCEWAYTESNVAEYGYDWNGDVIGYLENLDLPDDIEINGAYAGAIRHLPENAVVITSGGEPIEIYWAE